MGGSTGPHRRTDGGLSWDIPLGHTYGVFDGEISDVVIDPNNVDRLYIGVHRDGVYRSTDGGNTWVRLQNGIDTGSVADSPKIALGRSGTHGTQFVAVKMGERVYTSTDGGTTFTRQTDVGGPIWYFAWTNLISVDPTGEDVLIAGAVGLYRSTEDGASWTFSGAGVHSDNQSIAFDPADHDHVYVATDGGIWSSTDNGVTWAFTSRGLVATHFYTMGLRHRNAALRRGDPGRQRVPICRPAGLELARPRRGRLPRIRPQERTGRLPRPVVHRSQQDDDRRSAVDLSRDSDRPLVRRAARDRPDEHEPAAGDRERDLDLALDEWWKLVDERALAGRSELHVRSLRTVQRPNWYAGTGDGRIWHSTNSGTSWTELDTTALPDAQIQSLAVAPTDPNRLYVAFAGTGIRHLFRGDLVAAGNATWFDVGGALPAVSLPDVPLTGLALHPTQDEVIYVSTLLGVLRSVDGGDSWAPFDDGLPNAFVSDVDIRTYDRSLGASTMGRGIYRRYI
ncbi:MAG TPA: hypothetical protein VGR04_04520 [Acidimicrobiia bacterium]|nr:hypothetical protein [Acidimicrobiia bacterium]